MEIVSPENSFLDFNYSENNSCLNEDIIPLPKCDNLAIKAQIQINSETDIKTSTPLYVAISDTTCNVILDEDVEVSPICSLYRFVQDFEGEEVGSDSPYNLCYSEDVTPTITQEFTENPFDEADTDISFEMLENPTDGTEFIIYVEDKIYRFARRIGFSVITIGNVTEKRIGSGVQNAQPSFLNYMNAIFDTLYGTTTTQVGDVFTISGLPVGSYFQNNGTVTSVTGTTPTTNIGKNFIYNGGEIKFYSFSTLGNIYSFETSLIGTQSYKFRFYYNSTYNDITGNIIVYDGVDTVSYPIEFLEYDGYIDVSHFATNTAITTITIDISTTGYSNGLSITRIEQYDTVFFNVTTNASGNIPIGNYSKTELINQISNVLGFDFDCEFVSCCVIPEIEFTVTLPDDDTEYVYTLTPYWQKGFINYPETSINEISENCFTYSILDENKEVIACSNVFQKENDCCYVSKIEYSNNEDAFGFSYPTGVTNTIELPFFVHSPQHLVKEKVYRQTNGTYKRLSADIEKEYECETDYFAEFQHDKLITALKHDTVILTSNRLGFTDHVSQQGDYKMDWNSKIEFTAKAEFKLRKYFNGKNNNCGTNCN